MHVADDVSSQPMTACDYQSQRLNYVATRGILRRGEPRRMELDGVHEHLDFSTAPGAVLFSRKLIADDPMASALFRRLDARFCATRCSIDAYRAMNKPRKKESREFYRVPPDEYGNVPFGCGDDGYLIACSTRNEESKMRLIMTTNPFSTRRSIRAPRLLDILSIRTVEQPQVVY
jgi:hypothetical protein